MRPVFDPTGGPDVLVEKMIGTAYETVKRVYCHLPEIRRLDGVRAEIPTLAQTTVDNALAAALPPILDQLDEKVQAAEGWAGEAEASAEAAAQSALAATKVNMMFPFTSDVSQMIYDVTVISGQTDVNTAGMALWVKGAIEFDFTILSATTFMLNDATAYPDKTQMRVILNAHFNDLVHGFDQLLGALEQEYKDAAALNGRWCGVHVVPPTTRLDGSPLQDADEYQNRSDKLRYSRAGTAWVALNSSAQQLEQRLVEYTGSSIVGYRYPSPNSTHNTVEGRLSTEVHVLDFLTEAQRENARLRLGTLDCGPGIQAAINAAGNGQLTWPGGYIFGTGRELIVRYAQKWSGGGKGKLLTPFGEENVANCQIISCGDGTAYKTVKTRQLYRGSSADPQDAPISAILNIQHQGFDMGDISVKCWYDPERIKTDSQYLGHDWDVGVFVGCRLHCKIRDTAVVGCFRVASVYHDVTRGLGLPELFGWDGIQHPADSRNGGDGATISELITWGGKWGVKVQGGDPKPGLVSYGKDYTASLTATFSALPVINDTITLGEQVFTFVSDPEVAGQVGIGATKAECVSLLIDAAIDTYSGDTVAPKFRSGLYLQQGDDLVCVARDSTATTFKNIFVASVSAPARIVLSNPTPQTIPDPAPYYDEQLGEAIPDYRGSYGFSDFTMKDSQLFGSEHPTRTARDAIRSDKNWLIDTGGGAYSISGLAGNSSRMLQGHRYFNVRFDNSFDPFSVRLGRTHRDEFFGVQFDGNRTNYSNPDGSKVGNNLHNYKYGPVTRIPNITRRTRFYSLDTSLWPKYCNLSDSGSGMILSGTGGNLLTSTLRVTRGSLVVDRSESANNTATIAIYGGSSGQAVLRFKKGGDATTQASLRYDPVASEFNLSSSATFGVRVPSFNMESSAKVRSYVTSGGELVASGNPETVGATIFRVRSDKDTRLRLSDTELVPYVSVRPNAGNTYTCGAAGYSWSDMYSKNAVTVTSDANKKTPVQPLQAKELLAGSRLVREIGIYQWLESIDTKGADLARYHVGMTVQRAMEILTDCGLEATRYGFICFDEWQDEFDTVAAVTERVPVGDDSDSYTLREVSPEKQILVRAAGSTFGFREGPLHGLMLRAMAAQMDELIDRVTKLEQQT